MCRWFNPSREHHHVPVCKRLKQAVCKTAPFRFVGPNPTRHTNMAPSTSWSKSPASQAGVGSSNLPGVANAPEKGASYAEVA